MIPSVHHHVNIVSPSFEEIREGGGKGIIFLFFATYQLTLLLKWEETATYSHISAYFFSVTRHTSPLGGCRSPPPRRSTGAADELSRSRTGGDERARLPPPARPHIPAHKKCVLLTWCLQVRCRPPGPRPALAWVGRPGALGDRQPTKQIFCVPARGRTGRLPW